MKIGTIVTGSSQKQYRIDARLGEGVASVVYRAVALSSGALVALKVLRDEVGPIIEANFWQEGQILGELANAARLAGDERADVPRVLETRKLGKVRFLAMELVVGQPLDRVLEQNEYLPEREALFVAQKVLHVLALLHGQTRRTYTDFQLQNIWLQRDAEGKLTGIKVMDWNHVSERVKEGQPLPAGFAQADLARFGVYFYRMLTGKGADERGETERALEMRAGERWNALSLGSHQLVLRALHPHTARRFADTTAFREAVLAQQALWASDGFDLFFDVRMWLKNNQNSESEEQQTEWILAKLDMAARLGAPPRHVAHYQAELKREHIGEVSRAWRAGHQYYRVEQYRQAGEKWRAEAEAKGRLDLWRWVVVAEAGVQFGRRAFASMRERVEGAVEALQSGEVKEAVEILSRLELANGSLHQLEMLKNEADARINIDDAFLLEKSDQLEGWEEALKRYQVAQNALQNLPEPIYSLIYESQPEWPNLSERIDTLIEQITQRSQSDQAVQQVKKLLEEDFDLARQVLELHLRRDPSHRPLVRLCLTEGKERLQAGNAEQAEAILATGVLYAQVPDLQSELRHNWLNAVETARVVRPLESMKVEYEQEMAALRKKYRLKLVMFEEQHEKVLQKQQQELNALRQKHASAVRAERESNQQKLANLRRRYQETLAKEEQEHQKTWATLRYEYEHMLATAKEQYEQKLATAKEQYEQKLATAKEQHEQELSTLQAEQQRALKVVKFKQQEALGAVEEEKKDELVAQLRKLLDEGRWDEFLELAAHAPDSLLSDTTYSQPYIKKIRVHFHRAIRSRLMPLAHKLEQVLNLLDSDDIERKKRRQNYERMIEKLEADQVKWELYIKRDIVNQVIRTDPAQYGDIIKRIEFFLSFSKEHYPQLTTWLEDTQLLLEQGAPTPTTIEASQTEWQEWLRSTLHMLIEDISKPAEALSEDQKKQADEAPQKASEELTGEKLFRSRRLFKRFFIRRDEKDETTGSLIGENVKSSDEESRSATPKTTEAVTTGMPEGENVKSSDEESGSATPETTEVVTTGQPTGDDVTSRDEQSRSATPETTEVVTTGQPTEENVKSSDEESRSATPKTTEAVTTTSPEALIKEGMEALNQLTPESLEEAERCFEKAKGLLGGVESSPRSRQIRAGQTLIKHLVDPKKAYDTIRLIRPPELLKYVQISIHNLRWLERHSLMQWIGEMNRYSEEADKAGGYGRMVSAEQHRKKSDLLEKMINKVIDFWWDTIIKPVF